MAQWKSVPFTPERSLVRSQLGPLYTPNRITRGWGFCDVAAHTLPRMDYPNGGVLKVVLRLVSGTEMACGTTSWCRL